MKKLSFEEFEKRANIVHKNKYKYVKESFEKGDSKVEIICPIHGSFKQNAQSHLHGCGCQKCYNDRRSKNQLFDKDFVIKKFKEVHGDFYSYDLFEYKGMNRKSKVICPIHGEFKITPNHHFYRKQGCPNCSHNKQLTTEEFIENAKKVHGDKYDYSKVEYVSAFKNICIICPKHGEFWQTPHNHVHGEQGCPICNESSLENKIKKILDENDIEYKCQKKFSWLRYKLPMRLDFYLPKYNVAIECQGEQHFEKYRFEKNDDNLKIRQSRDKLKKILCENNGINIIYFSDKKYNENIVIDANEILNKLKNNDSNKGKV